MGIFRAWKDNEDDELPNDVFEAVVSVFHAGDLEWSTGPESCLGGWVDSESLVDAIWVSSEARRRSKS